MPTLHARVFQRNDTDTSTNMTVQYKNSFTKKFIKIHTPHGTTRGVHEYNVLKQLHEYITNMFPYIPICPKLRYGVQLANTVFKETVSSDKHVPFAQITLTRGNSNTPLVDTQYYTQTTMLESPLLYNKMDQPLTLQERISYVYQVLLVSGLLNLICEYTHYDLHIDNTIPNTRVWKTGDYVLFVYDDDNQFIVDTCGVCPIIIDHEYAYLHKCTSKTMGESHLSHYGITPWRSNTWIDAYRFCSSLLEHNYFSDHVDVNNDSIHSFLSSLTQQLFQNVNGTNGLLTLGDVSIISKCADKLYETITKSTSPEYIPSDHPIITDSLDDIVQRLIIYSTWTTCELKRDVWFDESDVCQDGLEWILDVYDELDTASDTVSRLMYAMDEYIHDSSCPLVPLMFQVRKWFDEYVQELDAAIPDVNAHGISVFGRLQRQWGVVFNDIQHLILYDVKSKSTYEVEVDDTISTIVTKYKHKTGDDALLLANELYMYITCTDMADDSVYE